MSGFNQAEFLANIKVSNPFQQALRDSMDKTGRSARSIERATGCSHTMISHYRSGKAIPSLPVFCALAVKVLSDTHSIPELVGKMSHFYGENGGMYKKSNVKIEDVER